MRSSVIISTYNERAKLDLVLHGMARQTQMPDEILIADDGSSDGTDELIRSWHGKLGCEIKHVWQEDRGIRKTCIINKAVRCSSGDHLVFLDGDSIPHRKWLADHLEAGHHNAVLCGRRVKLGLGMSRRINLDFIIKGKLERLFGWVLRSFLSGDTKRYFLGIRLPLRLVRLLHPKPRKLMGVSFSLPRDIFFHVNGFDETWPERREDRDLELRLQRARFGFFPLLNRAIVYHLHHEGRASNEQIEARVREEERAARIHCAQGLIPLNPFDSSHNPLPHHPGSIQQKVKKGPHQKRKISRILPRALYFFWYRIVLGSRSNLAGKNVYRK